MVKTISIEFNKAATQEQKDELYNDLYDRFDLKIDYIRQSGKQTHIQFQDEGWGDHLPDYIEGLYDHIVTKAELRP